MLEGSIIHWNVKQGGAVSVVVGGMEFLEMIHNPHSQVNRDRHKRIEERVLHYSSQPAELDARLNLESHGLDHWENPNRLPGRGFYLEFYDKKVISREDRQGILKHLRGDASYQGKINPESPE